MRTAGRKGKREDSRKRGSPQKSECMTRITLCDPRKGVTGGMFLLVVAFTTGGITHQLEGQESKRLERLEVVRGWR